MCGIAGIMNKGKHGNPMGERTLIGLHKAMTVQKHRGPDDSGVCAFQIRSGRGAIEEASDAMQLLNKGKYDGMIGFNRLSIKDLSKAGHQPMVSLDKKVILAFNGEIYNDVELREMLIGKGHHFQSSTDTEVVLAMYLEYGFMDMLPKLNGMFAIVIMDLRQNMLFMARDRFGIKPLYYSFQGERLYFASELKCMIQFEEFLRELDMDAVNARLIFSRPSGKILMKNVEIMEPGQAMSMSPEGDVRFWKYFDIDDYQRAEDHVQNLNHVLEQADEIINDAVHRQMLSDVKVGCQVSGGIDSTLISCYAGEGMKETGLKDGCLLLMMQD